jgi:hypothetical protein
LLRLFASAAARANAQVRDAVYRGTMVCDKLPFTAGKSHEAIEVTVAGVTVCHSRIVRLRAVERSGLQGAWEATANMKRNMLALSAASQAAVASLPPTRQKAAVKL